MMQKKRSGLSKREEKLQFGRKKINGSYCVEIHSVNRYYNVRGAILYFKLLETLLLITNNLNPPCKKNTYSWL